MKIGRKSLTFPISEEILDGICSAALPTETFLVLSFAMLLPRGKCDELRHV